MKNKLICVLTALAMLAACVGLDQVNTAAGPARVHQHLDLRWQPGEERDFATHLPIITINTGGRKVPGTFKGTVGDQKIYELAEDGETTILADFSMIDAGLGSNAFSDEPTEESLARIRYRGNSSRLFDKKSYSIHLVDEKGKENPMELAGMASHNEWVLNGPYLDRTLLRNYLALNVAGEIMEYAPNARYCELYVDGEYQGLYLLMESVSRGEGRLNLTKPEKGSSVTSYIVRWDRTGKGDHELNNYSFYTYKGNVSSLDVRYPGSKQITEGRLQYVEDDISRVEKMLYSMDLVNEPGGFTDYLDLNSFAEYFIINEFFRNVDAGRFSTFYYKDVRGKLKTCVWDFNNACDNYIDYRWDDSGFSLQNAPWFEQLLKDKRFVCAVVSKYDQLRKGVLNQKYLFDYIDSTVEWLGESIDRNYQVWGYVFAPDSYGTEGFAGNFLMPPRRNVTSYEEAVEQLKNFIAARGDWLDEHIDTLFQYCHESKNVNELTR